MSSPFVSTHSKLGENVTVRYRLFDPSVDDIDLVSAITAEAFSGEPLAEANHHSQETRVAQCKHMIKSRLEDNATVIAEENETGKLIAIVIQGDYAAPQEAYEEFMKEKCTAVMKYLTKVDSWFDDWLAKSADYSRKPGQIMYQMLMACRPQYRGFKNMNGSTIAKTLRKFSLNVAIEKDFRLLVCEQTNPGSQYIGALFAFEILKLFPYCEAPPPFNTIDFGSHQITGIGNSLALCVKKLK